ncbi:MAG: hypothetical protein ACI4P8_03405 [Akkermansia sp.]
MKQNRFLLSLGRAALLAVAAVGTFFVTSTALSSCGGGGGSKDSQSITYGEFERGQKKIVLLGSDTWMVMEGGATHIDGAPGVQGWFYPHSGSPSKDSCKCLLPLTPNGAEDQNMSGTVTVRVSMDGEPFRDGQTAYASFLGLADVQTLSLGSNVVTLNFDNMTWSVQVTGSVKYSNVDATKDLSEAITENPNGSFVIGR